jgi:hypothetical protein
MKHNTPPQATGCVEPTVRFLDTFRIARFAPYVNLLERLQAGAS